MSTTEAAAPLECDSCADDTDGSSELVDGDRTCENCIQTCIIAKFQAALKSELNWPVKWGPSTILDPVDFQKYFDDWENFYPAWQWKEVEYNIDYKKRLYCKKCDAFLRQLPFSPEDTQNATAFCKTCGTTVCGQCGREGHKYGECPAEVGTAEDPFKDFPDMKQCPNCTTVFRLEDGCNYITCDQCKVHWCWVCLEIEPDRHHWDKGKPCTKWNQPGEANAHHVDPAEDAAADAARPEVFIPDAVRTYMPQLDPSNMLSLISDLAFVGPRFQDEDMSDEALKARAALLGLPNVDHSRRAQSWDEQLEVGFNAVEGVRHGLERLLQSVRRQIEAGYLESLAAFERMVEHMLDNFELLHNREMLEERLEEVLERHTEIIDIMPTYEEPLRRNPRLRPFIQVLMAYFTVMPERLTVAASERHQFRVRNLWAEP